VLLATTPTKRLPLAGAFVFGAPEFQDATAISRRRDSNHQRHQRRCGESANDPFHFSISGGQIRDDSMPLK
jgi:hypothetical protein